ncbi:MAG: DUF58 domain-containing protein [Saprospirales bacterium]|nr:DUF58 domain-containing protein [Saprospirales bacterium]MBK6902609.1 DUF58 domain-containing protein [Saprospirales bacterium]MBK7335609.1 DUF58 domain-containing protein [Saprospirales bacterium]
METKELLKKVRKIEIKTRGLTRHLFSGEYHSAFKGRGMSFSEVRTYQFGDDIRNIDWNVTARTGEAHIKVFEEERELTVMLLVDVSQSSFFGSTEQFKREVITEICAILAFSATQNNDKVGAILFSEEIEVYLPPKKGRQHILRIIRELVDVQPRKRGTDIGKALEFFNNVIKKRSICFVCSDFQSKSYETAIRVAGRKHDMVGIHLYDPLEKEMPNVGLIRSHDAETGRHHWIDTSSRKVRKGFAEAFKKKEDQFLGSFRRSGADTLSIRTGQRYVDALLQFFKKRSKT